MSSDLWIGTLISIPVSIGVALAVPHIQAWIDRRGMASHAKRHSRIREEYEEVLYYALRSDMMIARMLATALTFLPMILILLFYIFVRIELARLFEIFEDVTAPFVRPVLVPHRMAILFIGTPVVLTIFITFLAAIIRLATRRVDLFLHVRHLGEYVESIPGDIRDRKLETIVLAAVKDRAIPGVGFLGSEFSESDDSEHAAK